MPYGQPSGAGVAGYRLAAQGLNQLAQAARDVGEVISRAERAKYDQGVKIEAATLQSQMELSVTERLEALKLVEDDPDGYRLKAAQVIQEAHQATLKQAKYPEAKAALEAHLPGVIKTKGVDVLRHSNDLYKGRNLGLLDTNLANLKTLGAMAPDQPSAVEEGLPGEPSLITRVKGATDYYREGRQAIADAAPLLGPKAAADKQLDWRQDYAYERGYRGLREDPDAKIGALRSMMNPEQYDRLEKQQDSARKNREAEWDKYYARIEKEAEEERQGVLTNARADALSGALTLERLEQMRTARLFRKPDEFATLYKIVTDPKDVPSDPAVLQRVDLAVHQQWPTIGEGQLDALLNRGLSRKDWLAAKEKLVSRRGAIANEEQSQAEQLMLSSIGKGPLDSLDDEDGQLYSIMLREQTARSNAFPAQGGKERPLDVAREIIDRVAPIRQERLRLAPQKLIQTLDPEIRALTSADATTKLNAKRGVWSRERVLLEERKIVDLFRAEQRTLDAGTKKPAETGGPKPLRQKPPRGGRAED